MTKVQTEDRLRQSWERYRENELKLARQAAQERGFELDENQVHISGERFLMSGAKLVLLGQRRSDGKRIVFKFSSDSQGAAEIRREHLARQTVQELDFAYRVFHAPEELLFEEQVNFTLSVTLFIEEKVPFLKHSAIDQFFLALRAFEVQESLHITTYVHERRIAGVFGRANAEEYLKNFEEFKQKTLFFCPNVDGLTSTLERASRFLVENHRQIDRYDDFLTHTDFVPHNLRIVDHDIYLLDHSSIRFGNKYESWARFLNYMVIHHHQLERWLVEYVKQNRREEYLCLRLMRVFKIGFLLEFYARATARTDGDLQALSHERIHFWLHVLNSILDDVPVSDQTIQDYQTKRDQLRSEEEKNRQKELQQSI